MKGRKKYISVAKKNGGNFRSFFPAPLKTTRQCYEYLMNKDLCPRPILCDEAKPPLGPLRENTRGCHCVVSPAGSPFDVNPVCWVLGGGGGEGEWVKCGSLTLQAQKSEATVGVTMTLLR